MRVGILGCQPVVDGGDGDAEFAGEPAADDVVLRRRADQVAAAVDPQHGGPGSRRARRPVQADVDAGGDGEHLDVGGAAVHAAGQEPISAPEQGQRVRRDEGAGDEPGCALQFGVKVGHPTDPTFPGSPSGAVVEDGLERHAVTAVQRAHHLDRPALGVE